MKKSTVQKAELGFQREPSALSSSCKDFGLPSPPDPDFFPPLSEPVPVDFCGAPSNGFLSVFAFVLGAERLALPTLTVREVASRRSVHQIPHRGGKGVLGIVNLNGELVLHVALDRLLDLVPGPSLSCNAQGREGRMVAMARGGECWVFFVDEMEGIYHCDPALMQGVPIEASNSSSCHLKGILFIGEGSVGLLDEELLFASLRRSLQWPP